MQTRKKASGRNASHGHASPRVSRAQRKFTENGQAGEKKVTDMITSSTRKKKLANDVEKKSWEPICSTHLTGAYDMVDNETSNACLVNDGVHGASVDCKDFIEEADQDDFGTIFSPGFHLPKSSREEIIDRDNDGSGLSSEVSAIYLAMKNSKLECVNEHGQVPMTTDLCVEDEEFEDFDDFDPYLFIKSLPDLSSVVPTFRPLLLPKQTRSCPPTTLVLDLDETLVHSALEPCDDADFTFPVNFNSEEHVVYVRCRPHLKDFLERVSRLFEIIIFTASQSIYAEQLLNVLDPKRKIFRHRVFRESCVFVEGNYLKDLSVLGRDLAHVIIIDNSPQAFGFQVDNGIPIESWFDNRADQELLLLLPFLESLVGVEDVRPLIAKKFNLREKIAAAADPSLGSNRRDLLLSLQC